MLFFDSYLATIKNSVDSKIFSNLFFNIKSKKTDILKSGKLSCAVFVSSVLYLFKMIRDRHATVDSTLADMKKSGWKEIKEPKIGCVILWDYDKGHRHLGFYTGADSAISNDSKKGKISKHHYTYGFNKKKNPKREIVAFYWNKKLDIE